MAMATSSNDDRDILTTTFIWPGCCDCSSLMAVAVAVTVADCPTACLAATPTVYVHS